MSAAPPQPEPLPTHCDACGKEFPAGILKRASLPSVLALAAAGDVEPENPDPVPWHLLTDRNWYCPSCRFRVHLRRGLGMGALIVLLALLPFLLSQWGLR